MQPITDTADRALRALLDAQPLSPAKVAFAWRMAAGTTLAAAGAPHWTPDGQLVVRVTSDAWRREVLRARPLVLDRLARLLGPGAVTSLLVDVDRRR